MTLDEYKVLHENDTPEKKLQLLFEAMIDFKNNTAKRVDAEWRKDDADTGYYKRQEKQMYYRAYWLYCDLLDVLRAIPR